MDNERNVMQENNNNEFNLGVLLRIFLLNWKLFAVSIVVCLSVAFFYLYKATKIYQVSAKVLLQDTQRGSFASQMDLLADFGYQSEFSNAENEIEVMNSLSVVRGAVKNAGLYISYSKPGFLRTAPVYKTASPVNAFIEDDDLAKLKAALNIKLVAENEKEYSVNYEYESELEGYDIESEKEIIKEFPYVLKTVKGNVLLSLNEGVEEYSDVDIRIAPLMSAALAYKGSLAIAPVSKTSSVAVVAASNAVPANGIDFIDAVIKSFNDVTNEDKRQVAIDTEVFLMERIDSISSELSQREERLAKYMRSNQMMSPELDAPQILRNKVEYEKKVEEMELHLKNAKYLNAFVNDPKNDMQIIPSTLGIISDPSLANLVTQYNKEVAMRNQLLLTATTENPVLKVQTENVRVMQNVIRDAFKAFEGSLNSQYDLLKKFEAQYTDRLEMSPDLQRSLVEITRERDIKSQLYVMLLQKFEENALTLAVTANNLRCIDPALCSYVPIAPRSKVVYVMALLFGILLPSVFVYLKEALRTKLGSPEEVEKLTEIPMVASIPVKHGLAGRSSSIVVRKNKNDIMAEAFRTLRTNLQFVQPRKDGAVIMFTSTISGEGKTFVSTNFAVSTALLGKKVLMVGADIRRPRLAEVFDIDPKAEGLTSYLCADEKDVAMLDKFITPSKEMPNLYLLSAGIVPPNPAELLSKSNLEVAIDYLSKKFDYIIIDTAPVGLVSDSLILSRIADLVVYVARVDYTEKTSFDFLNSLSNEGKLKNVSIVVNGDDVEKRKRTYGYVNRYSSKYSYYGYTYNSDGESISSNKEKK